MATEAELEARVASLEAENTRLCKTAHGDDPTKSKAKLSAGMAAVAGAT